MRKKGEGGRRKEEGGRRKEEGGRRKEKGEERRKEKGKRVGFLLFVWFLTFLFSQFLDLLPW